jgi:hypothetical protein
MFDLGMPRALLVFLGLSRRLSVTLGDWGCFSLGNAMPVSRLDLHTTLGTST